MSKSLEEPTQIIEAVTVAHDELDPPLSQLKSILLLLPVVLNVPVYYAPFISKVNTLESPTWSMLKLDVAPVTVDAVVLLPIVLF